MQFSLKLFTFSLTILILTDFTGAIAFNQNSISDSGSIKSDSKLPLLINKGKIGASPNTIQEVRSFSSSAVNTTANPLANMVTHGRDWWIYPVDAPYSSFSDLDQVNPDLIRIPNIVEFDIKDPEKNLANIPSDLRIDSKGTGNNYYFIKFSGPIYQEWLDELSSRGIKFFKNYKWFTRVAYIPCDLIHWVESLSYVSWVGIYEPAFKIDPFIGTYKQWATDVFPGAPIKLEVEVFLDQDPAMMQSVLQDLGCKIHGSMLQHFQTAFFLSVDGNKIPDIAKIHGVAYIHESTPTVKLYGAYTEESNLVMELGTYVSETTSLPYRNAGINGEGQIVTVMDSGLDVGSIFFANTTSGAGTPGPVHRKVESYVAYGGGDLCNCDNMIGNDICHGCFTSCYAAGNILDFGFYYYDFGIADMARIVFQDIGDQSNCLTSTISPPFDITTAMSDSYSIGSFMQNHSWGTTNNGYISFSSQIDAFTFLNRNYIVFASAGNDGITSNTVYAPATAKNVVAVGGTDQDPNEEALFFDNVWFGSSVGPTASGRIKPDVLFICADSAGSGGNASGESMPGPYVTKHCSPWTGVPSTSFWPETSLGGTSLSSPMVMGATALIRDYFIDGWYPTGSSGNPSITPSGMLMKAGLIASTEIVGPNSSPTSSAVNQRYSNMAGYGRVNLDNLLKIGTTNGPSFMIIDDNVSLSTGNTQSYSPVILGTAEPIKIAVVWYDTNTSGTLDIDYDLTVTQDTTTWRGNNFSGGWSTIGGPADHTNSTEAVFLEAGSYSTSDITIDVLAFNAPAGNNPTFAIFIVGNVAFASTIAGNLDTQTYFCNGTVCGSINDTNGVPTDAYYNSDTGGVYGPVPISGTVPDYFVECRTINQIGAADSDNIWLSFTGSDLNTYLSSNSVLRCTLQVCVSLVDPLRGGCDNDLYHDDGEILNYYVGITNYESFDLPETFDATLQLAVANPDVTIIDGNAVYPANASMTYAFGDLPFVVEYTGDYSTICNGTISFEVVNIASTDPGNWTSGGCTPGSEQFNVSTNYDAGTTLLFENFEGMWPPAGWSIIDNGGSCVWEHCSTTSRSNGTTGSGLFADADSDICGIGSTMNTELHTPTLNLSSFSNASLEFDHFIDEYSGTTVCNLDISTNGGLAWTNLDTWLTDPSSHKMYDISAYTGSANAIVRFHYIASDREMFWQVDNVTVLGGPPGCEIEQCISQPNFFYDQMVFDDSDCNDDGVLDPGDYGWLDLYLGNYGNAPAYGTVGTLSCPTCPPGWGEICSPNNPATYGYIPFDSGFVYAPVYAYLIRIDESTPCGTILDFELSLVCSNPYGPQILNIPITVGAEGPRIRYEEHYLIEPEATGASGRMNFTSGWTSTNNARVNNCSALIQPGCSASPPFGHASDGDGFQCCIDRNEATYHLFDMSVADFDIFMNWEWDEGLIPTNGEILLDYTDDGGNNWYNLITVSGTGTGPGDWSCYAGSIYDTIAFLYPGTENFILNNPNFGIRFDVNVLDPIEPSGYFDNIILEGLGIICTASPCSGTCTSICFDPLGLTNNTALDTTGDCLNDGVDLSWLQDPIDWGDNGIGTRTYDVLRDGISIASGIAYGTTTHNDNTGTNGTTYLYQIRYNNGCGFYSITTGSSAADVYDAITTNPVITIITDNDPFVQDGIFITYTAGSPATAHDLYDEGGLIAAGYVSGTLYNPGDTTCHDYYIRATNGICFIDSNVYPFCEGENGFGVVTVPTGTESGTVPMLAVKAAGTGVDLTWDNVNCASPDYHLIWGWGTTVSVYTISGSDCSLTNSGNHLWTTDPDTSADWAWFLVIGNNGSTTEGGWGQSSSLVERSVAPSGVCGHSIIDTMPCIP